MHSEALRPGPTLGPYPEHDVEHPHPVEAAMRAVLGPITRRHATGRKGSKKFVAQVDQAGRHLGQLNMAQLTQLTDSVRRGLRTGGLTDEACARAFALVREVSIRTLGMRHYDSQIIGGRVILDGMLAEMETGEGKTLTASLPACTAALAGIPVHVITVNDYLAARDKEFLEPLYQMLGLSVGVISDEVNDPESRRAAYACDVTYCTNKQVTFDYLRDRVAMGDRRGSLYRRVDTLQRRQTPPSGLLLRGLCFGIVDEADSVLIDEALTPLKLSGPTEDRFDEALYRQALDVADALGSETDDETVAFRIRPGAHDIEFTQAGRDRVAEAAESLGDFWASPRRREALVRQALVARHLFVRDRDYIVRDDSVQIIDANTGRVMPDRSWEMGLHQLIETKENVEISKPTKSIAQITYQRFFPRYLRLGAMSGTAHEVAGELWHVYGLRVTKVPSHKPSRRRYLPTRVYGTEARKLQSIVERVKALHEQGRPVLIGTRTVEGSECLSEKLFAAGLEHEVLNAKQDESEALIVARAGRPGSITVATNMAGRGTDIVLAEGAVEAGGLHVISAEPNDACRIDRQLYGRCGRQGDPGSCEAILSMESLVLQKCAPRPVKYLYDAILCKKACLWRWLGKLLVRMVQRGTERRYSRGRRDLLRQDRRLNDFLAFGGPME
jgi:preprotein translocase subunit SecA